MSSLDGKVLVLDRGYQPVHVVSVKSAIYLLFRDVGKILAKNWNSYDLDKWIQVSKEMEITKPIRTPRYTFDAPDIILLNFYVKKNLPTIKCNKSNICLRDDWTCGYCSKTMTQRDCTIDHIIPTSLGGKTKWDNVVVSCAKCNNKKSNKTIEEAGMELKADIYTPNWSRQILKRYIKDDSGHPWLSFLR